MNFGTIRVTRRGPNIKLVDLVREGEPDVDLLDLFRIATISRTVKQGDLPVVVLEVWATLVENDLADFGVAESATESPSP